MTSSSILGEFVVFRSNRGNWLSNFSQLQARENLSHLFYIHLVYFSDGVTASLAGMTSIRIN